MAVRSKGPTTVRIGWRRTGGVAMMLTSCRPASADCSVRGMGVAVMVRTWMSPWPRMRAFCAAPNCCSSSMTMRPSFEKRVSSERSACVPMTMPISPFCSRSRTALVSAAPVARDRWPTSTPLPAKRRRNVS